MTVHAPHTAPQDLPIGMGPQSFHIRRLGGRPLRFRGVELAMAMGFSPEHAFWYEINVYRKLQGAYAVAVRLFHSATDEQDVVQAWPCDGLGDVLETLERYDATQDVTVSVDPTDPDLSAAELAAHALDLRARTEIHKRAYAAVLGDLLHQLDDAG
ncbi:MAG: hypothetical protein AAFU80_10325 [Pseudomonadota bacterium]